MVFFFGLPLHLLGSKGPTCWNKSHETVAAPWVHFPTPHRKDPSRPCRNTRPPLILSAYGGRAFRLAHSFRPERRACRMSVSASGPRSGRQAPSRHRIQRRIRPREALPSNLDMTPDDEHSHRSSIFLSVDHVCSPRSRAPIHPASGPGCGGGGGSADQGGGGFAAFEKARKVDITTWVVSREAASGARRRRNLNPIPKGTMECTTAAGTVHKKLKMNIPARTRGAVDRLNIVYQTSSPALGT